jgi:3-methyladenine DNA glycosylase AlkD
MFDTSEVCARIAAGAADERLAIAPSYFPSAMVHLGAANPVVDREVRALARQLKAASHAEVIGVVTALVEQGVFEVRNAGYGLVRRLRPRLTPELVERWGQGNDNWCSVDTFATCVAGPAWLRGEIDDALVLGWTESADRWWRRTALVSTVALNLRSRGGSGDVRRTLMLCAPLVADRDDMVVKALSWALRSLVAWDPEAVARFIAEHDVAARVRREVRNKLATGKKNPGRGE